MAASNYSSNHVLPLNFQQGCAAEPPLVSVSSSQGLQHERNSTLQHFTERNRDWPHGLCPDAVARVSKLRGQWLPLSLTGIVAMRLLDTKTLELRDFHAPPEHYAILSHTWGAEEVTYQHLIAGTGPQRQGWKKLKSACALAAKDDWSLLWMDTCCIDKTDSVDLSEAINSMYRWYQSSSICYAYLEDVELVDGVPISSVALGEKESSKAFQKMRFRSEFKRMYGVSMVKDSFMYQSARRPVQGILSRWFTRGWTLQELIAPRFLLFLDRSWRDIGGRACWAAEIEAMTAIDRRYFSGERSIHDRHKCPAATKFAWASLRNTSRPEDRIYCLLGILNVNMPLLYGEGTQNAFHRIQRKIIKHSDDESILAWQLPNFWASPTWDNILAPELEFFQWLTQDATYELELHRFDADRPEFAMTNKGLKVIVPLLQDRTNCHQGQGRTDIASPGHNCACTESCICHLQLNCVLKNIRQPLRASSLRIELARDRSRNEVFVRVGLLVSHETVIVQLEPSLKPSPEPRSVYLMHDASLRYDSVPVPGYPSSSTYRLQVSDGISIRDVYSFSKTDARISQGLYAMWYELQEGQAILINAEIVLEGHPWSFWIFLGFFDSSPRVLLLHSDALHMRYLKDWHMIDPSSRTRIKPWVFVGRMLSSDIPIGNRAELVLNPSKARVTAQVQPRQPDAWKPQPSYMQSYFIDHDSHLLSLNWMTTSPKSPVQT